MQCGKGCGRAGGQSVSQSHLAPATHEGMSPLQGGQEGGGHLLQGGGRTDGCQMNCDGGGGAGGGMEGAGVEEVQVQVQIWSDLDPHP